ncbi:HTH domain-containing protein [Haloarcula litorea]|uniref:HTH domain-containing protein n=1 Tax=Haloarcula litorea TaxID=3032579 RepID=UPI0023E843E2|nr:HTH domain-containing protein [Halomicroarcula sp. GDY20]
MTQSLRLAVYVRTPVAEATASRQSALISRAESLHRRGLADGVSVDFWHRLETGMDPAAAERLAAMERWAESRGCSLAPAFDRRDRHSAYVGDDTVVTLPVVCLVAEADGDIVGVYPHVGPCGSCSVADGLDRIEAAVLAGEPLGYTGSQR